MRLALQGEECDLDLKMLNSVFKMFETMQAKEMRIKVLKLLLIITIKDICEEKTLHIVFLI